MQVCNSLQTDNHASTPPLSFLQTGCPSCRPTNSIKALNAERKREVREEKCNKKVKKKDKWGSTQYKQANNIYITPKSKNRIKSALCSGAHMR